MPEKSILFLIGKSIREGKYLTIRYKNSIGEITPFWISILDINADDELRVNMFNVTKDDPIINAKIYISKIQTAEILKFSHYEVPEGLVDKINEDESLQKYEFDNFDNRRLNYYLECYKANNDPFLYKEHLMPGLDLNELVNQNPYQLTEEQKKRIIQEIYHNDYHKYYHYELALNEFSIDLESRGKFVVAFRKLTFDPVSNTLKIGAKTYFNTNFFIKDVKFSLSYYSDICPTDFEEAYKANKVETINTLYGTSPKGELLNTKPEIVVLGYAQIDISTIYEEIDAEHSTGNLQIPLKAFFQNMSSLDTKNRTKPNIVLYDEKK